jgi:hypothetical protein
MIGTIAHPRIEIEIKEKLAAKIERSAVGKHVGRLFF